MHYPPGLASVPEYERPTAEARRIAQIQLKRDDGNVAVDLYLCAFEGVLEIITHGLRIGTAAGEGLLPRRFYIRPAADQTLCERRRRIEDSGVVGKQGGELLRFS